jgi:hypothetical protein
VQIDGTVTQCLDAPPYSYLSVTTSSGDVWAAVPAGMAQVGKKVRIRNAVPVRFFEAQLLRRRFDVVYFGVLDSR